MLREKSLPIQSIPDYVNYITFLGSFSTQENVHTEHAEAQIKISNSH